MLLNSISVSGSILVMDKFSKGLSEARSTIGLDKVIFKMEFAFTLVSLSLSKVEIAILMMPINNNTTTTTESTTPTMVDNTFLKNDFIF